MTAMQSPAIVDLAYVLWLSEVEEGGLLDFPYPRKSMRTTVRVEVSCGAMMCQMW